MKKSIGLFIFLLITNSIVVNASVKGEWDYLNHQRKQQGRFYEKVDKKLFRELDVSAIPLKSTNVIYGSTYFPGNKLDISSSLSILDFRSSKANLLVAILLLSSSLIHTVSAHDTTFNCDLEPDCSHYFSKDSSCVNPSDWYGTKSDEFYKKGLFEKSAECALAHRKQQEKEKKIVSPLAEVTLAQMDGSIVSVESIPPKSASLPDIARGHEEVYNRFMGGKLIYRPTPGSDVGKIEMWFKDFVNPTTLEGTFDLSRCGDTGKYLSINSGYRKGKKAKNANKIEVWITPKFVVEDGLSGWFTNPARHLAHIMDSFSAPVGVFWTWGGWDNMGYYDYLTTQNFETLSDGENLYDIWARARTWSDDVMFGVGGWGVGYEIASEATGGNFGTHTFKFQF